MVCITMKRSSPEADSVHVALLRGINVGGKNRLPMKDLVAMFRGSGCSDVQTYIQSGNVLFSADTTLARRAPGLIEKAIADRLGLRIPVLTRTTAELEDMASHNPFPAAGADPKSLHVAFLLERPSKAGIAALDPDRSPPDEFAVRGREIYLRFPNGVAGSKLTTRYFDSTLATTSTVRNWSTVLKLIELAGGRPVQEGPATPR